MCGVSGAFNLSPETVQRMNDHQASRGPDNAGVKEVGRVIFGHTRLSIIDKSERSNQPTPLEPLMVYNGEIYNHEPEFGSDTRYLQFNLRQFVERPDDDDFKDFLNALNGMFAFAFHDANQDAIYLVRDRFGIKPLYYTHQKDFFAFASTPATVALSKPNWGISKDGLQEYLALGATTLHSMFDGILAVPPGHYVTFNCRTNEVKTRRWYYPKFVDDAIRTIENRAEVAIDRVKLTCDFPQIMLLSGGIDSSLLASRYTNQAAIHLRSPEQEYAEQVAKRFNLQLSTVDPEETNAKEALTDYITKSGDPTMAGIIPYITCKEIKKLGYRVAITANGADELFFGYDRMKNYYDQRAAIYREFSFTENVYADLDMFGNITRSLENKPQLREIYSYLMFDLNKTLDFASMCHSVEVRVPYLDHELVEAALSISQEHHLDGYGNKSILKKMLLNLGFDRAFVQRPKLGFSLHYEPKGWDELQFKAMQWYKKSGYEQLGPNATDRQKNYHAATVTGLYVWCKKFMGVSA